MCDFKTALPEASALDPKKRVRYTTGLVLGVDEFNQDQLYFRERDHLHQRSLHGYGAVVGLGVEVRDDASGRPEVVVAPGLAVTPRGESVCVPLAQCASLDDWLERHAEELAGSPPTSPPADLRLWVELCYRECETDRVPVLGDPCRTLEDAAAPSRIADDFELKLSLERPDQEEEEAIRAFGRLLRSLEITSEEGDWLSPEDLAQRVRALAPADGSPPEGSPPEGSPPEALRLHRDDLPRALALAFRVWVSEVRPRLASGAAGCPGGGEACVLLARLDFPVGESAQGELQVAGDAAVVAVDRRGQPLLLSTRLLQEWTAAVWGAPRFHHDLDGLDEDDHAHYLLVDPATRALVEDLAADGPNGPRRITGLAEAIENGDAVRFEQAVKVGDSAGGDLRASYPNPRVRGLQGRSVFNTDPVAGDVLAWDNDNSRWHPAPVPPPPLPPHGGLAGLDQDDHPQYLLVDPATRALAADLAAANHKITGLAAATADGDAVRFEQAVKRGDAADGDLADIYPNPRVRALQGRRVAFGIEPQDQEVLTWEAANNRWRPAPIPSVGGVLPDLLEDDLVRIVATSWVHGGRHALFLQHDGIQARGLALAFGDDLGRLTGVVDSRTLDENTVRLWVQLEDPNTGFLHYQQVKAPVLPARVVATSGTQITATETVPALDPAPAVVLLLDEFADLLIELGGLLTVEVRGDHVLDTRGRAIDAEFVRAELPTGARAGGAVQGIQGGRFESWLTPGLVTVRDFDLNLATAAELVALPGIGPTLAERIVARRDEVGAFNSLDDLREVSGISDSLITNLRDLQG